MADDMRQLRMRQEDAQDCAVWRNGILGNRPTRANGTTDVKPMMMMMMMMTINYNQRRKITEEIIMYMV